MKILAKLTTPVSLDGPRKPLAESHDGKLAAYFDHLLLAGEAPASGKQCMAAARDHVPEIAIVGAGRLPHS